MDSLIRRSADQNAQGTTDTQGDGKDGQQATQGQPSDTTSTAVPSTASTARVAPIRTGATAGNVEQREQRLATVDLAARPPYRVPTTSDPRVTGDQSCDEEHPAVGGNRLAVEDHSRWPAAPLRARAAGRRALQPCPGKWRGDRHLRHGARRAHRRRSPPRTSAARARASRHGGQPHEAGSDALQHRVGVEREREDHHRDAGERQHLIDEDPAVPLDAQVLRSHQPGDPQRHGPSREHPGPPSPGPAWILDPGLRGPHGFDRPRRRRCASPASRPVGARGWRRAWSRPTPRPGGGWRRGRRVQASSPACGSSSSHSSARRTTRQASAVRRCCPADSVAPGRWRGGRRGRAARAPRRALGVGADRRAPERDVLAHGQVEVETVAVAEEPDEPAQPFALGGEVAPEHRAGAADDRAADRRTVAAASSCRRRWGRAAARSHRRRPAVSRRRWRGSDRARRPHHRGRSPSETAGGCVPQPRRLPGSLAFARSALLASLALSARR